MRMTIYLYKISDDKRKLTKNLGQAWQITGTMRSIIDVIDPVIQIEHTQTAQIDITKYNYIYIPDFNRYYFINDISADTDKLWSIKCHVDVLMSFADELKTVNVIASRNSNVINYYLNDSDVPLNAYSNVATFIFDGGESFRTDIDTPYVLVAAGKDYTE